MMTQTLLLLLQTTGGSSSKSPILGYIPIALLLIIALLLPFLLWAMAGLLNRKTADAELAETAEPDSAAATATKFPARYFVMAMLFVIFAAQLVFILLWAVVFDRLALFGVAAMLLSLFFSGLGYFYIRRMEALDDAPEIL